MDLHRGPLSSCSQGMPGRWDERQVIPTSFTPPPHPLRRATRVSACSTGECSVATWRGPLESLSPQDFVALEGRFGKIQQVK